jgi:hypothetical protein
MLEDTLRFRNLETPDGSAWPHPMLGPEAFLEAVKTESNRSAKSPAFAPKFGTKLDLAFDVDWGDGAISDSDWKREDEGDVLILKSEGISLFRTSHVIVGNSIYPFRRKVGFAIVEDIGVIVPVPLSDTSIAGRGRTVDEALEKFELSFHVRFQQLLKLSTLSMSEDDLKEWEILSSIVDVEEHKRRTPIELRKIGTVVSLSPFQLQWLETDEPTSFDLAKAPAKLASYSLGDEFEAVVEFNRGTREITRILSVGCTPKAIASKGNLIETETIAPIDWGDL